MDQGPPRRASSGPDLLKSGQRHLSLARPSARCRGRSQPHRIALHASSSFSQLLVALPPLSRSSPRQGLSVFHTLAQSQFKTHVWKNIKSFVPTAEFARGNSGHVFRTQHLPQYPLLQGCRLESSVPQISTNARPRRLVPESRGYAFPKAYRF